MVFYRRTIRGNLHDGGCGTHVMRRTPAEGDEVSFSQAGAAQPNGIIAHVLTLGVAEGAKHVGPEAVTLFTRKHGSSNVLLVGQLRLARLYGSQPR